MRGTEKALQLTEKREKTVVSQCRLVERTAPCVSALKVVL